MLNTNSGSPKLVISYENQSLKDSNDSCQRKLSLIYGTFCGTGILSQNQTIGMVNLGQSPKILLILTPKVKAS